jgi:hypothetical protein
VAETSGAVLWETLPSNRTSRRQSMARSLVQSYLPLFPLKAHATGVGYGRLTVVIGAITTVLRCSFIASGGMTKQGAFSGLYTLSGIQGHEPDLILLGLCFSCFGVGSALTNAIPHGRIRSILRTPARVRLAQPDQMRGRFRSKLRVAGARER